MVVVLAFMGMLDEQNWRLGGASGQSRSFLRATSVFLSCWCLLPYSTAVPELHHFQHFPRQLFGLHSSLVLNADVPRRLFQPPTSA